MGIQIPELEDYVSEHIGSFHASRINALKKIKLREVLKRKNPYLFRAKDLTAPELVTAILDAYLSSSEEALFGGFLEGLALFICERSYGGTKSSSAGIDLDFLKGGKRYVVSIKSGKNWGNSSQHKKQEENFRTAIKVVSQAQQRVRLEAILGICYGEPETTVTEKGYTRVVGRDFWQLISGKSNLYTDIIRPLGHEARGHNDAFHEKYSQVSTLFTAEFIRDFCDNGNLNWKKLVKFNSGGLKLPNKKPAKK